MWGLGLSCSDHCGLLSPAPTTQPLLRHIQAACSRLGDTPIWGVRGLIVLCVPSVWECHCRQQQVSQVLGHPLWIFKKS